MTFRRPTVLLLALAACLALVTAGPAAAAKRSKPVPTTFLGVIGDGPLFAPQVDLDRELGVMRSSGVGTMRVALYWDTVQPYASAEEVPPEQQGAYTIENGVPTDWRAADRVIGAAAARRLRLLPVVLRAPAWARKDPDVRSSPPTAEGVQAYAAFMGALVRRYGRRGGFWAANPGLPRIPVRQWQLWNEPAGVRDWSEQPGLPGYVELLRPAYRAVKAADPGARVVLAGLVGRSWEQLDAIYRLGGRGFFDAVAIHPFTDRVRHVMRILRNAREVLRRRGDARLPMLVTELSWPSAKGKTTVQYGFEKSERGQARRLRQGIRAIAAERRRLRIMTVVWSSWMSYDRDERFSFDYAGLRRLRGDRVEAKPAFRAFKRVARELGRR